MKRRIPSRFPLTRCTYTRRLSSRSGATTVHPHSSDDKLRIAIVGSGCAGLSCAVHLAPLVEQGRVAGPIDVFAPPSPRSQAREIGMGLWSTALQGLVKDRPSHELIRKSCTEIHGTWLDRVGYRTPNGTWLMQSKLPTDTGNSSMPSLLFLSERDFMSTLQKAVHWEEHQGTVQVHGGKAAHVQGILEEATSASTSPYSAKLRLREGTTNSTARDYHLIIAADGPCSELRRTYGGYDDAHSRRRLTGTSAFLQQQSLRSSPNTSAKDSSPEEWEEITGLEDRGYTVFRGNAPVSRQELKQEDISFQTWGTSQSMRFASVPMWGANKKEMQVWFATINDASVTSERDPVVRQERLLEAFSSWHSPVADTIRATPPAEILMDRAVAHKHCVAPLLDLPTMEKPGPAVVFIGDAFMTVDPILAQGCTLAMEEAAALVPAVTKATTANIKKSGGSSLSSFDPYKLRRQLRSYHDGRVERLVGLLRVTELVQALGQPSQSSWLSWVNTYLLRPCLAYGVPQAVKGPLFDAVLRYSLGRSIVAGKGETDLGE